jgi:hypothetical protein
VQSNRPTIPFEAWEMVALEPGDQLPEQAVELFLLVGGEHRQQAIRLGAVKTVLPLSRIAQTIVDWGG